MKTAEEHFNEFPEPYRTQAIENVKIDGSEKHTHYTADEALIWAFAWSETPQGHGYWQDFHSLLYDAQKQSNP